MFRDSCIKHPTLIRIPTNWHIFKYNRNEKRNHFHENKANKRTHLSDIPNALPSSSFQTRSVSPISANFSSHFSFIFLTSPILHRRFYPPSLNNDRIWICGRAALQRFLDCRQDVQGVRFLLRCSIITTPTTINVICGLKWP